MKSSHLGRIVTIVALLLLASCRTAGIYNVESASLNAPPSATLADIEEAIERAGAQLGWRMTDIAPGHLEARLPIRSHVAVADILFDTKQFSIHYKDSSNLKYNAENNTIHSNYNGWIKNLQNGILAQASII